MVVLIKEVFNICVGGKVSSEEVLLVWKVVLVFVLWGG